MTSQECSTRTSKEGGLVDVRVAHKFIMALPGNTQSVLVADQEAKLWVLKSRKTPEHKCLLVNEFLGARIAEAIGLSVPTSCFIRVDPSFLEQLPKSHLTVESSGGKLLGLQFGSAYASRMVRFGKVTDFLPGNRLHQVENLAEVAGALVFDAWVHNTDRRQAVFVKRGRSTLFRAFWIDHEKCFGENWDLGSRNQGGCFLPNEIYRQTYGWSDLEPWLTTVENLSSDFLHSVAAQVPEEWLEHGRRTLDELIDALVLRRKQLKPLIRQVMHNHQQCFPAWRHSEPDLDTGTGVLWNPGIRRSQEYFGASFVGREAPRFIEN